MGRVIIKFKDGHLESFKCKSKERAEQIAKKRNRVYEWNFYDENERVPKQKKPIENKMPTSFEDLEILMKRQGLI
jgi:hypothetical protein